MAGWISTTYSSFTKHETEVPQSLYKYGYRGDNLVAKQMLHEDTRPPSRLCPSMCLLHTFPTKHAETIYNKCANVKLFLRYVCGA